MWPVGDAQMVAKSYTTGVEQQERDKADATAKAAADAEAKAKAEAEAAKSAASGQQGNTKGESK